MRQNPRRTAGRGLLVLGLLAALAHFDSGSGQAQTAPSVDPAPSQGHPQVKAGTASRGKPLEAEITWIPAHPRVGEEIVFLAADQGPGVTYRWLLEGNRRSGRDLRWTFEETQEIKVRLEIRRGAERDTQIRSLTIAPAGPDPAGGAPSPCPAGMSCTYLWNEDLGRHEVRRFRPSLRSTGNLDLQLLAMPATAKP
ncbi:MAG: hypothetical protein KDD47_27610 [Acidobacteria bacterium]|nr:hypothetical protein [Acidobacteriota bacterium]